MRAERVTSDISVGSLWIQTQCTTTSFCLMGTQRSLALVRDSRVQIIRTDLMGGFRCCVERERVSGRCYWEVDRGRSEGVGVSVSCRSISRRGHGDECRSGWTDQSWKLFCSPSRCLFRSKSVEMKLPGVSGSRIGVYVDHSEGSLSFYSVSDTMTLIHRVHTTFTQPLYPGILLSKYTDTVKLCHLRDSVKYCQI